MGNFEVQAAFAEWLARGTEPSPATETDLSSSESEPENALEEYDDSVAFAIAEFLEIGAAQEELRREIDQLIDDVKLGKGNPNLIF